MTDGSVKVLVVDDHAAQRTALGAILADLDVAVVQASSGRDALRCLLQQEFAVILLDVNMPVMDGFETAALIRQRRSSQHTPIIFITAYSDDAYAARGYSLGAVDYILSPVQPDVLRTKVSVFIDLYRKAEQIERQREALWRYAAQLQQLSEASLAINSAPSIEGVLEVVAESAGRIIGAHQSGASAVLENGTIATTTRVSEQHGGHRATRTSRNPGSVMGLASQRPQRLCQADLEASSLWQGESREIVPGLPMRGWLAAPLSTRDGHTVGIVQLSDKSAGEFSNEDEGIVVQLAQMASIAIENSKASDAREANRLKDEFLGVLSHELRTPLQAMLTWIGILQKNSSEPALVSRGIEVIERSAKSQVQLIGDLLDVSRIIRGQLHLETASVDLVGVIGLALETLRPAAVAKTIEVVCERPSSDCRVLGDPTRLQQVVWNLVANAIKFTPDGGRVDVRVDVEPAQLNLHVSDTGPGIPPEFLPHVFERFRQADSGTARQHGGLGLGLAIVRHLTELHGGSVQAENLSNGAGARFTIKLPRQATPAAAVQVPRGAASASGNGLQLDGIRVVLVEDEVDARESLTTALELFGASVVAVNSAAAALSAMEAHPPDILLSDVGLPGEDGYTLIKQVRERELELGRHVPAAALTAHVRAEDRATALRAGFDAHVHKPIDPLALARLVKRLAVKVS